MSKKSVSDLMRPLPVLQLLGGPLPGITGFLSSPRLEGVAASLSAASVPGVGGVAPELSQLLFAPPPTLLSPFTVWGASGSDFMDGGLWPPEPGSSFTTPREALAWTCPWLGLTLFFTSFDFIMFCNFFHQNARNLM